MNRRGSASFYAYYLASERALMMSDAATKVTLDSQSVQCYLNILQAIINRMATNSASAKTWCIALVSAVIVIIADKGKPGYVWISIVPILLFFLLDSYYLGLERQFREQYNNFIKKVHSHTATVDDIFIISPVSKIKPLLGCTLNAGCSVSVWPFYLLLTAMLLIVRFWIL